MHPAYGLLPPEGDTIRPLGLLPRGESDETTKSTMLLRRRATIKSSPSPPQVFLFSHLQLRKFHIHPMPHLISTHKPTWSTRLRRRRRQNIRHKITRRHHIPCVVLTHEIILSVLGHAIRRISASNARRRVPHQLREVAPLFEIGEVGRGVGCV